MKKALRLFGLLMVVALVAGACAEEEPTPTDGDGGAAKPGAGMKVCQVTDTGGVDDRSFNQTAFEGMERAAAEYGVETAVLESTTDADYDPNIQAFVDQGCDLIVTVGFLLGDATAAAAEANPDQKFSIVDFAYDPVLPNVLGQVYATDQAGFLAGYLAAGMTQTGKLGTYGGINIGCGVTCFMDGYAMGAAYYNQQKGTDVEVLGWDLAAQDGLFTGDFTDQAKGRQVTEELIGEGADIILPVAGPVGLGTVAAVEDSPEDDAVIWVDVDGCVSVAESCPLFMTSVQKNISNAIFDIIGQVVDGTFEGGSYQGTLENGGVGIAPYHEFEGDIPEELKQEVADLQEAIIAGEISLEPADYA